MDFLIVQLVISLKKHSYVEELLLLDMVEIINLKTFDASQSPSSVINTFDKNNYNDLYGRNIEKLGFTLRHTVIEYFNLYNNILYPLEFEINEIDERVELYNKYDDSYYIKFITEVNKIFEKYKLECNPKNKNLVLISEKCIFEEKYTHDGYECGKIVFGVINVFLLFVI